MHSLRILTAGPHASIQDRGRPGQQWLGIPEGGVLDRDAFALGNALVGNPADAAVIEVCLGNFSAELMTRAKVALTGTSAGTLTVQDPGGHSMTVEANRSVDLAAGRIIRLGVIPDSNTATIAISGGVDAPLFYHSRSTSPSAGIGGFDGGFLQDGQNIPLGVVETPDAAEWMASDTLKVTGQPIRCVRGPQDDRFTENALSVFFSAEYTVSPILNRMGMRLDGEVLEHRTNADIPSDGIVTGTVQVPGNGLPIVLLADHQSTGGYTKIATVITADMPRLARLRPGEGLRFTEVTVAEAEAIARQHHDRLGAVLAGLQLAPPIVDLAALYALGDTT